MKGRGMKKGESGREGEIRDRGRRGIRERGREGWIVGGMDGRKEGGAGREQE